MEDKLVVQYKVIIALKASDSTESVLFIILRGSQVTVIT